MSREKHAGPSSVPPESQSPCQSSEELADVLASKQGAEALAKHLTPIVLARVRRALLRRSSLRGEQLREASRDVAQDVFAALFADQAQFLRGWCPERGLSLPNYVGLLAERRALNALALRKQFRHRERKPLPREAVEDLRPQAGGLCLSVRPDHSSDVVGIQIRLAGDECDFLVIRILGEGSNLAIP